MSPLRKTYRNGLDFKFFSLITMLFQITRKLKKKITISDNKFYVTIIYHQFDRWCMYGSRNSATIILGLSPPPACKSHRLHQW